MLDRFKVRRQIRYASRKRCYVGQSPPFLSRCTSHLKTRRLARTFWSRQTWGVISHHPQKPHG